MDVTKVHEEKNTMQVAVNIPGHDPRVTSPLFRKSRLHLIERDKCCWVCGCTAAPLEAHHYPIERSFAEMVDWSPGSQIRKDFPAFAWGSFSEGETWVDVPAISADPADPMDRGVRARKDYVPADVYMFVDDMNVNGRLLCKAHHIGADEGVHALPEPVFLAQRYGKEGFKFSDIEIIHHEQGEP